MLYTGLLSVLLSFQGGSHMLCGNCCPKFCDNGILLYLCTLYG